MSKYEFRFARLDECEKVMKWIDENWRKNHIMSQNKELFLREFGDDDKINVFLAVDKENGEIAGLRGMMFSAKDPAKRDAWGSIWKVKDDIKGLLGLEILTRSNEVVKYRYSMAGGVNPKTAVPLSTKLFSSKTGIMSHFYLLNPAIKEFKIAKIAHLKEKNITQNKQNNVEIKLFKNIDELKKYDLKAVLENQIPQKDLWYINKRFFDYPIYTYELFGIIAQNSIKALFAIRKQEFQGMVALRIVDFIGEQKAFLDAGEFLYSLFDEKTEYIDFLNYGFNESVLFELGFEKIGENDENIIPNYFNPFVKENIKIHVTYYKELEKPLICKADGDQDRPN